MINSPLLTTTQPLNIRASLRILGASDLLFITGLVGILQGVNELALGFSLFVFATNFRRLRLPKSIVVLLGIILIAGIIRSMFFIMSQSTLVDTEIWLIIIRIRFYVIQIIFAFSASIYFQSKNYRQLMAMLLTLAAVGTLFGLAQIGFNIFVEHTLPRLSMFSSEPSSAAMLYAFLTPLLVLGKREKVIKSYFTPLFVIIGTLILSKALIIIFVFWFIIWLIKGKKYDRKYLLLLVIPIILSPLLVKLKPVQDIIKYFTVLAEFGIYGLNSSNAIWTSFTMRTSGAIFALIFFWETPIGIGFGTFHLKYFGAMSTAWIAANFDGFEIENILQGVGYATPKATFLELLVSCGIFFLIPMIIILVKSHLT